MTMEERANIVASWLARMGVVVESVFIGYRRDGQVYYNVFLTHSSTPLEVTVRELGVPDYTSHNRVVYYAMTWIADGLNSVDDPDYETFCSNFGFEEDDSSKRYWQIAVEGRAFFDAILGEGGHQDVHAITQLESNDSEAESDAVAWLKGEA